MITIPTEVINDLVSAVGSVSDSFTPIAVLFLGLSVAFFVARKLIQFAPSK